jgi:hypothetical protein
MKINGKISVDFMTLFTFECIQRVLLVVGYSNANRVNFQPVFYMTFDDIRVVGSFFLHNSANIPVGGYSKEITMFLKYHHLMSKEFGTLPNINFMCV